MRQQLNGSAQLYENLKYLIYFQPLSGAYRFSPLNKKTQSFIWTIV